MLPHVKKKYVVTLKPRFTFVCPLRGCMRLWRVDLEDFERNIFDENEIIREYAPHERKPLTTEGPTLEGLDAQEYYLFHSNIYQKANARNPCKDQQFKCGNNVCIPLHLRCDGFYHCNDMTDEYGCDQYNAAKRRTTAPPSNLVRTTQAAQVLPWWRTTAVPATTARTTTTRRPWSARWNTTIATPTRVVSTVAPSRFFAQFYGWRNLVERILV